METMEIVLLIMGTVIFIVSFFIPMKGKKAALQETDARQVKEVLEQELKDAKGNLDSVVEDRITQAVEKTERSMERLSNEKIMAIDEYSETVLEAIHKNHNEVMFLYDMLNDKQKNLLETVRKVDRTVKEAEQIRKEEYAREENCEQEIIQKEMIQIEKKANSTDYEESGESVQKQNTMFEEESMYSEGGNSNHRILELYQAGKTKVDIAKELGLGVGEVKLVIDLFKNV